jgi:hypothetical protein
MHPQLWEDLIISILSVNRYPLEKTYSILDALRAAGLTDPRELMAGTVEEVASDLCRAGYDRGKFMNKLVALRLISLGAHVEHVGIEESERVLTTGDAPHLSEFLRPVKGIGPFVIVNFLLLRR